MKDSNTVFFMFILFAVYINVVLYILNTNDVTNEVNDKRMQSELKKMNSRYEAEMEKMRSELNHVKEHYKSTFDAYYDVYDKHAKDLDKVKLDMNETIKLAYTMEKELESQHLEIVATAEELAHHMEDNADKLAQIGKVQSHYSDELDNLENRLSRLDAATSLLSMKNHTVKGIVFDKYSGIL